MKAQPPLFASGRGSATTILGIVADSGQVARLAAGEGVDFLLALSAGVYRNQGVSPLAAYLPFRNSNDLTETHVRETVLPSAGATPVVAGMLASDPTCPIGERLGRLQDWGVAGVANYPTVSLLDGSFRAVFEAEGCTLAAEIAMLAEARARGLRAVGFVGDDPDSARRFAESGVDALILTPGLTRFLPDIHERRDRLQQAIRRLNAALEAVRSARPGLTCLVYGGPIALREDLEQVYRQATFDGFVGGSIFGRYPIESGVTAAIRRFKGVVPHPEGEWPAGLGPMIGATDAMRDLFRLVRRASACDLHVCIEGESGVGKELVATHIHSLGGRSHAALVTLNCGAIPETLLESELFGHERGAFTGAEHRRLGKFELAHEGTLFLDEVGDLSPRGQVALLRAIQQREITRVGGSTSIPVSVRILSASNRPLADLVAAGKFRADLYYRLNNLTLAVPPLRDRLDDIPLLVEPLLAAIGAQMGREFTALSPEFSGKLRRHSWPGNLRELQHVLAQSALLEDGPILQGWQFSPLPAGTPPAPRDLLGTIAADARAERLAKVAQALREAGGNKSRAAGLLGISRKTLYAWLGEGKVGP